jgi:hypothetical protein
VSAYRVVIPMLVAGGFPETIRRGQIPTCYIGDIVSGAEPQDI